MSNDLSFDVNPDVVCSELTEGGVLLDLASKQYFALNASGLLAWKAIETSGSLEGLAAALDAAFPGRTGDDRFGLVRFARALGDHHLITPGKPVPAASPFSESLPSEWQMPTVTPHGRPLAEVVLSPFDPTEPIPE